MKNTNYFFSRNIFASLMFISLLFSTLTSCEDKKDEGTPPELPPYESMAIDFSNFTDNTKATSLVNTNVNFGAAGLTVFVWNLTLGVTLAVPVASFYESFKHVAVFIGDATWQWTYDVKVLGATYTARMTGQIRTDNVKWNMYVSRSGINAFEEFKWFEGTSDTDGNAGQWILYHSYELQEAVIQIDWKKTGNEIGDIKYTYIRSSDNGDAKQLSNGSYIQYGLQDDAFDAFYSVHSATRDLETDGFKDVNIEWSTDNYYGRIKAFHYFQDTDWHCWNNEGVDIICE